MCQAPSLGARDPLESKCRHSSCPQCKVEAGKINRKSTRWVSLWREDEVSMEEMHLTSPRVGWQRWSRETCQRRWQGHWEGKDKGEVIGLTGVKAGERSWPPTLFLQALSSFRTCRQREVLCSHSWGVCSKPKPHSLQALLLVPTPYVSAQTQILPAGGASQENYSVCVWGDYF